MLWNMRINLGELFFVWRNVRHEKKQNKYRLQKIFDNVPVFTRLIIQSDIDMTSACRRHDTLLSNNTVLPRAQWVPTESSA